jgi:hypothetical protein
MKKKLKEITKLLYQEYQIRPNYILGQLKDEIYLHFKEEDICLAIQIYSDSIMAVVKDKDRIIRIEEIINNDFGRVVKEFKSRCSKEVSI